MASSSSSPKTPTRIPVPKPQEVYTREHVVQGLHWVENELGDNLAVKYWIACANYKECCVQYLARSPSLSTGELSPIEQTLRKWEEELNSPSLDSYRGSDSLASKLQELRTSQLLGRYGDYLSHHANDLRNEGKILKPEGWQLLANGKKWTEVAAQLEHEADKWEVYGKDKRVKQEDVACTHALWRICQSIGHDLNTAIKGIQYYARSNCVFHSNLDEVIVAANPNLLSNMLFDDLESLPKIITPGNLDLEKSLRTCITYLRDRWFDIPPGYEDNANMWTRTRRLDNLIREKDPNARRAAREAEKPLIRAKCCEALIKLEAKESIFYSIDTRMPGKLPIWHPDLGKNFKPETPTTPKQKKSEDIKYMTSPDMLANQRAAFDAISSQAEVLARMRMTVLQYAECNAAQAARYRRLFSNSDEPAK